MMIGFAPVQIEATSISASTNFKGNSKRRYFAVYSDVPCNISLGGATFALAAGVPFSPVPAPSNDITVEPVGGSATVMEG